MSKSVDLVEVWRGDYLECIHRGHAVVVNGEGEILDAWGDPEAEILPRSSCKMLQALPLVQSGAADKYRLTSEHLALACASHNGAHIHTDRVTAWLDTLDLSEQDLRCGAQWPKNEPASIELVKTDNSPCQIHNNCSGKHAGFLTLNKHLGGGSEYIEVDHTVQQAALAAFEDMCQETSNGYGIDGCSAPNFSVSLKGLANGVARISSDKSGRRLVDAMAEHPLLIAGEGKACSEMMRAMEDKVVIKTGAEGVYIGILPDQNIGVALKIEDGATRASEAVIAAILVRLGVADAAHPLIKKRLNAEQRNRRDVLVGHIQVNENLR